MFLDEITARLTVVPLEADDYTETLRRAAAQGVTGGRIYDALLLRCAEKAEAQVIYTWNVRHFQALAPTLSDRIRTP